VAATVRLFFVTPSGSNRNCPNFHAAVQPAGGVLLTHQNPTEFGRKTAAGTVGSVKAALLALCPLPAVTLATVTLAAVEG
jgi:hypothetical protein